MDRWLQSFTSFCDLTAAGVSNCCASSSNLHTGQKIVDLPELPQYQERFARTPPVYVANNASYENGFTPNASQVDSSGYGTSTNYINYLELRASPSERQPVEIQIHTFNYPRGYANNPDQNVSSTKGHVKEAAVYSVGSAQDFRAHCFGGSAHRSCLPQHGNVQGDGLARYAGSGGGGDELAIHRAAELGSAEALRLILRCHPRRSYPATVCLGGAPSRRCQGKIV